MSDSVPVQFLKDHQINPGDFPGAAACQGGFMAMDVAGFPADVAAALFAAGFARPAPAPAAPPPVPNVTLFVQKPFTYAHCDYLVGDVGGFPKPTADRLVADGFATVTA